MFRLYDSFRRALFPLFRGIPAVALEDTLRNITRCDLRFADWHLDRGAGSLWDSAAIGLIAQDLAPRVCFEIGTGHGRTSLVLAMNSPPEATVYTLDIADPTVIGSIHRGHPDGRKVRQLTGDSAAFDYAPHRGRVDLVVVDGDHSYAAVVRDTATALDLLAPRGRIIWDDFDPGWPGVVKAIKRLGIRDRVRHIAGTKLAYFDSTR